MTRYVLAGHFGPGDAHQPADGERARATRFDLLDGQGRIGRGIGHALNHLRRLGVRPTEVGVDLTILAAHVHAADTRLSRVATSEDGWTREIGLLVPVSDPGRWEGAAPVLLRMLRFLTGDHWSIDFRPRPPGLETLSPQAIPGIEPPDYDGVCLFSGGLDSLVGALDYLMEEEYPLFVSHAGEGAVSGPQRALFAQMAAAMKARGVNHPIRRLRFALAFPRNLVPGIPGEDSTRSRSFLFLAIAALAGSGLRGQFEIRIPENGLIALNVPLDPTRLGSNSTRTTHPFYIRRWNELLNALGVPARVVNRYWDRTKGEMVADCKAPDLLRALTPGSVSCAHPSAGRWTADDRRHCGTCVPCLIRRAAIEGAWGRGNDPTGYRCDDLTARPLDARRAEGQQVRGFQYAVRRLADDPGLARILVHKPGPLTEDLDNLDGLADVYRRGMVEVGRLLHGVRTFSSAMPEPPVTGSLVDFHCHLDLFPDFEGLVTECERRRVYTLAVTTTPRAWMRNRDLCGPTTHVRAALGLHPQLVADHWRELDLWERHLDETRYVGEVGLDAGPRHFRSLDRQKDVFRNVLQACASAGGRTLSVHSVRAATAVLDLVEAHLPPDRGTVVLHWFSGSQAEARRAVALGCRFSVNGQMLRDERGARLLRALPRDRLLLETDGPFVAEAGRTLRPPDTAVTLRRLAVVLGWDVEACRSQILANLRALVDRTQDATVAAV